MTGSRKKQKAVISVVLPGRLNPLDLTFHFYLVIKKPSSLISKLAKRKSQLSVPAAEVQAEVADMTDQQRSTVRKKCKEKVGVLPLPSFSAI